MRQYHLLHRLLGDSSSFSFYQIIVIPPPQAVRKAHARLKYPVPLYKVRSGFLILTEKCLTFRTVPPPDRLKSQLSNPLRVRFSRSLCILVWSCQIRDSQRVVPELPSLSTVYGLFHPLFCHSGHQFIHCLQVHRPPQVI